MDYDVLESLDNFRKGIKKHIRMLKTNFYSKEEIEAIKCEWVSGGTSGGSCWGGVAEQRGSDPEADFDSLDEILEELFPNITYLKYKKIEKLIRTYDYNIPEYYGNCTTYTVNYIKVEELYNFFVESRNEERNK
jgi:hypothetical protein